MKKLLVLLITVSMLFSMSVYGAATPKKTVKVKVNSKIVNFGKYTPYSQVNGVMVPLAEAVKAAGGTVEWSKDAKNANVKYGNVTINFVLNKKSALVNGKAVAMLQAATLKSGKTYVPARFLYEQMGGTVTWDSKAYTVVVTIKKPQTTTNNTTSINVAMHADKDFKPYVPELMQIDDKTLKELHAYKDDFDTPIFTTNNYVSNKDYLARHTIDYVTAIVATAKGMAEIENNVDYRTIGSKWIQQYRYFFMPESGMGWSINKVSYQTEDYIRQRYNDIKQYKVIKKAEFLTDTSMIYKSKTLEMRVRGRLKYMYTSADSGYYKKYGLSPCELNKWYYRDFEFDLGDLFSRNPEKWPHSKFTYCDTHYLNEQGEL